MGLTSLPLLVLAVLLALGAPVACLVVWNRVRGPLAAAARFTMIVTSQALALLLGGVAINDHYGFYASWEDLVGGGTGETAGIQAAGPAGAGIGRADFRRDRSLGEGIYAATYNGERSGVRSRILVWVPPEYDSPADAHRTYPVVELLPGYPGSPSTWFHAVRGVGALQDAIAAHRAHPFILVAPTMTVEPGRDTECVDFPAGPRVETWLADDVRTAVTSAFRAERGRASWGVMGFSTGGYCAAKLALRRPDLFGAAVSMQGDTTPQTSQVRADPALNAQNSLPDILRTQRPPVGLLLAGTRQDRASYRELVQLVPLIRPPTQAFEYVLKNGGHNAAVWNSMLPNAYAWLSDRLSSPRPA